MLVGDDIPVFSYSLRQLVSLESGLWQFVCENELYKEDDCWEWRFTFDGVRFFYYKSLPKFRLLESALVSEEELGKFLVDNIVIERPLQNPQMDQISADREEG